MLLLAGQTTPIGPILLSSDESSLTGLWLEDKNIIRTHCRRRGRLSRTVQSLNIGCLGKV